MPADRDPAKALLEACADQDKYPCEYGDCNARVKSLRIVVEALEGIANGDMEAHHAQEALARAAEEIGK